MKRILTYAALLSLSAVLFTACSNNNNKAAEETTVNADITASDSNTTVLEIEANDLMKFNTTELKAIAGKPIQLTLKNTGTLDKSVMGHNFVVLKPGTDIDTFDQIAMTASDTEYIPASENKDIIAHTKLTGGGESDTIVFTINEKGTYDFICSFPGHAALMKGKLIIE